MQLLRYQGGWTNDNCMSFKNTTTAFKTFDEMKKRALITGITGQDGSYLAELLLKKGYEVHGILRRVAIQNPEQRMWRINHLKKKIQLHAGTMESYASIFKIFNKIKPHEFYHLAAQSYVDYSFQDEFSTLSSNVSSTHYCLSAIETQISKLNFILLVLQKCLVR